MYHENMRSVTTNYRSKLLPYRQIFRQLSWINSKVYIASDKNMNKLQN
jgi:hypothetical protein